MAITFTCPCGQSLAAQDEHAGLQVRCPACHQTPFVPHTVAAPAPPSPVPTPSARPWLKGADAEEPAPEPTDPNNPFGFTNPAQMARARDRQAQERENPPQNNEKSLEGSVLNGGVAGGALAMLVAVVWFVGGLAVDLIFYYPPILFIIGLIAFFKGLIAGPKQS